MTSPPADSARRICLLADLPDPGSRSFAVGDGDWPARCFLVRRAERVYAYVNRCPHAGHPLNWRPDRFLTPDGALLQCSSHGALFDPATGVCVAGPCVGRRLIAIDVRVDSGWVVLLHDPQELARRYA